MSETGKRPLERTIPLEFPVTVDGVTYTEITLRRLTAKQVAEFLEHVLTLAKNDPDARMPVIPIADVPEQVLDALDDDDRLVFDRAAADFYPRRLMEETTPPETGSASTTGKPTAPSSARDSAGA